MNWQEWVEFAEDNWQAALKIREDNGLTTILLAHQVAEKYLKAVLVSNECLPERSHDLVLLLRSIKPVPDADLLKAARELNYYLPRARYQPHSNVRMPKVWLWSLIMRHDYGLLLENVWD
jgi:HEPN domain-containing protein